MSVAGAGGWRRCRSLFAHDRSEAEQDCRMSQITIIVNGPSGVGKSSLTTALQVKWPRPLVAVAFDDVVSA